MLKNWVQHLNVKLKIKRSKTSMSENSKLNYKSITDNRIVHI